MEKFKTLADAVALAEYAHRNQLDKAGFPYVEHPKRVLANVQAMGAAPYVQIAAIFHDVPEDTAFSHEVLEALGFSEAVTKLTKLLDRDYSLNIFEECEAWFERANFATRDEGYKKAFGYVENMTADEFYYARIAEVPEAKVIKIADINDNLLPWRLAHLEEKTQDRLKAKYAKALELLGA